MYCSPPPPPPDSLSVTWCAQTDNNDAYAAIASMLSQYGVTFCFTCLEMQDSEQPASCSCGPYELVEQTKVGSGGWGGGHSGASFTLPDTVALYPRAPLCCSVPALTV
jgi:hypothetical protein